MTAPDAPPPSLDHDGGAAIDEAGNQVNTEHTDAYPSGTVFAVLERRPEPPVCRCRATVRRPWRLRPDLRLLEYDDAVRAGLIDATDAAVSR